MVYLHTLCELPYYGILNICRFFHIITQKNKLIISKYESGQWGITNFPEKYTPLIKKALETYCSNNKVNINEKNTGGIIWNNEELLEFHDYAKNLIEQF